MIYFRGTAAGIVSVNIAFTLPTLTVPATAQAENILPGSAAKLGFFQQPTDVAVGIAVSPAVTVGVIDNFGNGVQVGSTPSITLTTAGGTSTLSGNVAAAATVGGITTATFNNLNLSAGGHFTLTALATDLVITSSTSTAADGLSSARRRPASRSMSPAA